MFLHPGHLLGAGAQGSDVWREGALGEHTEGCIESQADPEQKQSCSSCAAPPELAVAALGPVCGAESWAVGDRPGAGVLHTGLWIPIIERIICTKTSSCDINYLLSIKSQNN